LEYLLYQKGVRCSRDFTDKKKNEFFTVMLIVKPVMFLQARVKEKSGQGQRQRGFFEDE